MNSKRIYFIIGTIVILFTLVTTYFAFNYEADYFTIITDNNFKATYSDTKWIRNNKDLHLLDKNYEVYDETGYIGNYNVSHLSKANRWFIYTDKMKEVEKIGEIVGFKTNMNYEIKNFVEQEFTNLDKNLVIEKLKTLNIVTNFNFSRNQSFSTDLNGDKVKDKVIVSNLFQDIENNSDAYSMILGIVDNNVYTIYFNGKLKDESYSVMHANLKFVFDLKKDGIIELLISSNAFGQSKTCTSIYEMQKDMPIVKVSC